jgi:putative PIN family toxin of toxin-antitoxin system
MTRTDKFIVDTKVLVSSLLIRNSTAFKALEHARKNGLLLFSAETFLEFETVLLRKKFDKYFSKEERLQIIEKTYKEGVLVPVTSNISLSRDPKDNKFLNLAIDTGAAGRPGFAGFASFRTNSDFIAR